MSSDGEPYRGEGGIILVRDDEDDLSDQNGSTIHAEQAETAISACYDLSRGAGADDLVE